MQCFDTNLNPLKW